METVIDQDRQYRTFIPVLDTKFIKNIESSAIEIEIEMELDDNELNKDLIT